MSEPTPLALLLTRYLDERGFSLDALSDASGVSKATIGHWRSGTTARPYHWDNLLRVAAALGLNRVRTDRLLRAAGHPVLSALATRAGDREHALMSRWLSDAPNNLPHPVTSFIGREEEIADYAEALSGPEIRLLTLTGTGGSGKTRLGIEIARALLDSFPDGVWLVALAALSDPDLLLPTIARTLGVSEAQGVPLAQRLSAYLQPRRILLLLDNFEQLVQAGPQVTVLLTQASGLRVLVTSRQPLHLSGEHERIVAPLPLPTREMPPAELGRNPAVALFLSRAQAVNPRLRLTSEHHAALVELCTRLDGLPLAIELAAARVRQFPPSDLLRAFPSRLALASSGPRDVPTRHQTLRQTLDWSYHLLTRPEQVLFSRLAVFSGGWTLAAAEAACRAVGGREVDVSAGLVILTDSNLITRMATPIGSDRYGMLETIREYATEQLATSGAEQALRSQHAAYFLSMAEPPQRHVPGVPQVGWLAQLEGEQDNLRAALGFALAQEDGTLAARLAASLYPFWYETNALQEGTTWTQAVLATYSALPATLQAPLLTGAFLMTVGQGRVSEAMPLGEAALSLWREVDDAYGQAVVLLFQGTLAYGRGDGEEARQRLEASLTHWRSLGEMVGVARCLNEVAFVLTMNGQFAQAAPYRAEAVALATEHDDRPNLTRALTDAGLSSLLQGAFATARGQLSDALEKSSAWGLRSLRPPILGYLGLATLFDGGVVEARGYLAEALGLFRDVGDRFSVSYCLLGLAGVARRQDQAERAAWLCGAASAIQEAVGAAIAPGPAALYEYEVQALRSQLDEAAFSAAWAAGASTPLTEAIGVALAGD